MTQIYGIVSIGFSLDEVKNSDLLSCTTLCYVSSECHVAQFDEAQTCTLFKPGNDGITVNTDLTKENIAIFKLKMTSSCPSSYANVSFVYSSLPYSYTHTWNATGSQWTLEGCRDTWKRFDRDDGVSVCMKVFLYAAVRKQVAVDNCKNLGAILTGVDSVEECRWIHGHIRPSGYTGEWHGFWIDGIRQCTDGLQCNNFIWTDGYTTGNASLVETNMNINLATSLLDQEENCLTVAYLHNSNGKTINDCRCADCSGSAIGYVCGYKL